MESKFIQDKLNMPEKEHDLYFKEIINRWDEAIPLGNGLTGCLVWGNGSPLRFSLDRGDLWDTRPASEILDPNYNYKELIHLVAKGDEEAIAKRFDEFYNKPTPTKIPAGRIELNYGKPADNVISHLSLCKAVAKITLGFDRLYSEVRSFLHAKNVLGFIEISGTAKLPKPEIMAHDFTSKGYNGADLNRDTFNNSLKQLGYSPSILNTEDSITSVYQKTCEGLEFAIVMGQQISKGNRLSIVYCVASSKDGEHWLDKAKKRVKEALSLGFDKVVESHTTWWEEFWKKSSIRLPDKDMERQWYLINYLFASCSRKGAPPMPLQGVWTADEGVLPPWKGDYHHDLNTQLSYLHYLKANHIEEGESFIDLLWNLVPQARKFASEFFDAPGLCLPSVMSIEGQSLGGWPMYATNLTNQIWLCQMFVMYWNYTGNNDFLKEKAYPYLKETAQCILRWLKEGEDGKLYLPLSSSPEIHDNTLKSWLKPNSNYDLALLIYLFKNLSQMADLIVQEDREQWRKVLDKLPQLAINEYNTLMVNSEESAKETHRHHSHLMSIYPLNLITYNNDEKDRKIIDASIRQLELLGTGLWVGYSFTWMANLYARQKNGEGAAYQLKLFFDNFCSQNGFHLNGDYKCRGVSAFHYRPFTLEGNICAADALQEMLLQNYDGVIRVFPAVPEEWKKKGTSFTNFRAFNGVLVSAELSEGELKCIHLTTEKDATYKLENSFNREELIIEADGNLRKIVVKQGRVFDLKLDRGKKYIIKVQK
jgi:alpha-L-fucosidase 2